MEPLSIFIGLAVGAILGWLIASNRAQAAQSSLKTQLMQSSTELAAERARSEERKDASEREKANFEAHLKEMKTTFKGLASASLEESNKSFLSLATERMKPLKDELEKLQKETKAMEEKRDKAYGSLGKELTSLKDATLLLQENSTTLTTALRGSSKARGDFGEMALKNIVELSGMTQHCDFETQSMTADGKKPDLTVKMPGEGLVPIDAKFPLAAYQDAFATEDPKARKSLLEQHAKDMRAHVRELKKRDYASQLEGEVDFTVMFLPGDHLLSAAFEINPGLQEEALGDRILIATPVTLVALLRTIGLYWRQHDLAMGARDIQEQAELLHSRIEVFANHLLKVGKHLGGAQGAYNDAIGSYEKRVLPAARKLEELNATKGELPELPEVETPVRALNAGFAFEDAPEED
jgi:DNA recombination protein RmuC